MGLQLTTAQTTSAGAASINETTTLRGCINHVIYEANGFSVVNFQPIDQLPVRVVGQLEGISPGAELILTGRFTTHDRYGDQFKVDTFRYTIPETPEGIVRYLGSGIIPGIGEGLAGRIVNHFGKDTLNIMDKDIDRLGEVSGIGKSKLEKIKPAWEEYQAAARLMSRVMEHGIGPGIATRIVQHFGEQSGEIVTRTPYKLTEVKGVGFLLADQIARNVGIQVTDPARIEAGIIYVLGDMVGKGHTCVPRDNLIETAITMLDLHGVADEEQQHVLVDTAIKNLVSQTLLRLERDAAVDDTDELVEAIYLPYLHKAEKKVAESLFQRAQAPPVLRFKVDELPPVIAGIELAEKQMEAVRTCLSKRVAVITGGPGVGKSTVVRAILDMLMDTSLRITKQADGDTCRRQISMFDQHRDGELQIALAAPTGKAAKRLAEVTGGTASTIHRLLGAKGANYFEHDQDNPLEVDVLILDEVSMVDISLFNSLLKALPDHAHLILVGDADQLPSVGAGMVMSDLVLAGVIPVVRLDTIYRQAKDSHIIVNAHRINSGEMPEFPQETNPEQAHDFYFFSADDQERAAQLIVNLVTHRVPDKMGFSAADCQVLTPLRQRGEAGANNLNLLLRDALNPARNGVNECKIGSATFREGDRVIQTKNNYDKMVFNGDAGIIEHIDVEGKEVLVNIDGTTHTYTLEEMDMLDLSYALTVHKSQGSEYPVVVMPVLWAHAIMLRRNLFYTGITRGKQMVILVGERRAIRLAISKNRREARYSGLRWRMEKLAAKQ